MTAPPRVLALLQLPPPTHGVAVLNAFVARSRRLHDQFMLRVEEVQVAREISDIKRATLQKLGRTIAICCRVAWALVTFRPDLVYFSLPPDGPSFLLGCILIAMSRATARNMLIHLHGRGVAAGARGWRKPLYRWVLGRGLIVILSPSEYADINAFVTADRVRFLPNAIPDEAGSTLARERTGTPLIAYISNLLPSKGALVLVEALRQVHATGKVFAAKLAGAETAELTAIQICKAIDSAGLASCVEYVGPVYGAEKDKFLRAADILSVPTYRDAFPLIVLEGMCYSLAVVSTREGAIPEMIEDGVSGLLVPPKDADALAAAIVKLLSDAPLRDRLGEEARKRYEQKFCMETFENNIAEIWRQATGWAATRRAEP
jgi:glycosyltransferase involved in cell wall biosynthesis